MTDSTAPPSTSDPCASDLNDQGRAAYTARSYAKATEWYRKAAEQGIGALTPDADGAEAPDKHEERRNENGVE